MQARKTNSGISQQDVKRYLSTQPAYARHKQVPKPRTSIWDRWILASNPGQLVAIDGWFLGTGTKSQFSHALVVVDAFTKLAAVQPIRNMTAENTAKAMEKVIKNFKFRIITAYCDRGKEFIGKPFRDMLKRYNVRQIFTSGNNPSKTALAESLIRSLRIILGRIVTGGGSGWNAVKQALDIYNNSPHRSIGNRIPNNVTMADSGKILKYITDKREQQMDKPSALAPPKFEKDDVV